MSMFNISNSKMKITSKDITEDEEKALKEKKANDKNSKDAPITRTELKSVLKAMDKDGFSTIMDEYIQETSNPNNVKEQNEFLLQSEKAKDLPGNVKLAKPSMGFCIKSDKRQISKSSNKTKIFVNLVSLEDVPAPKEIKEKSGSSWTLPYLVNKPRNDLDSKSRFCQTFDVVFNPLAFDLAAKYKEFKKFMCDNAIKGINSNILSGQKEEASMDYCLVFKYNYKGPEVALINIHGLNKDKFESKREDVKDFKTSLMKEIENKKAEQGTQQLPNAASDEVNEFDQVDLTSTKLNNINRFKQVNNPNCPKYQIKYSDDFELHQFFYNPSKVSEQGRTKIIIELLLDKVDKSFLISSCDLEIKDRHLHLKAENYYDCTIDLKCNVNEDTLEAKWEKEKKLLTVSGFVAKKAAVLIEKNDERIEIIKDEEVEKSEEVKKDDISNKEANEIEDVALPSSTETKEVNYYGAINEVDTLNKEMESTTKPEIKESSKTDDHLVDKDTELKEQKQEEEQNQEQSIKVHNKQLIEEIPKVTENPDENSNKQIDGLTSDIEVNKEPERDMDDDITTGKSQRKFNLLDFYNSKIYEIE